MRRHHPATIRIVADFRKLREKQRLTQAQLANRLGIPRSTLARYESGARVPDLDTAANIADALGKSLDLVDRTRNGEVRAPRTTPV